MDELNFPIATRELAQLIGVFDKQQIIDEFLTKWAVRAVPETGYALGDFTNEQILDDISDTHKVGDVMDYKLEDEEDK